MASESGDMSAGATEKLENMVTETNEKLKVIWNEVGFSEAERDVQIQALLQEVERLFDEKVADERAVRDTFVQSIDECKSKVLEHASRLGQTPPDLETDDDGTKISTLALTQQLVHFEAFAGKVESAVVEQETKLSALRETMAGLCAELEEDLDAEWQACGGCSPRAAEDPDAPPLLAMDVSDASLAHFEATVAKFEADKAARVAQVKELVAACSDLLKELAVDVQDSDLDKQILGSLTPAGELVALTISPTCVGIGAGGLANLEARLGQLEALRDERSGYLMEMGEKVARLWELLGIGEDEQAAFEASLTGGLSEATIRVGERELSRLEELKKVKMIEIIAAKRDEIERLWEATSATSEQRAAFTAMAVADESAFTDELLDAHDTEIVNLEKRLETMQPLLKLVQKYEEAVAARAELKELQKNPDRLKGRGSAAQLKLEEQMAKKIKHLPKIIESLTKQSADWEKAEGVAFTVIDPETSVGRRCIDVIQEGEERWAQKKSTAAASKKAAKDQERASLSGPPATKGLKRGSMAPGKGTNNPLRPSKAPALGDASARRNSGNA